MQNFVAIAIKERDESNWTILVPDFPEIASVAERSDDVFSQARDALPTAVEARLADNEAIPQPSRPEDVVAKAGPGAKILLLSVPADVSGTAVRVNVSMDRVLLSQIDTAARQRGMSRSAFVAEGAQRLLREA